MLLYKVLKSFYASPLDKRISKDALIYRYENSTKISIRMSPSTDTELNITTSDFEYDEPALVTWFYAIEPAPGGKSTAGILEFISQLPEDIAGGGIPGEGGDSVIGDMVYKGEILSPTDFPELIDRKSGNSYKISENSVDPLTGQEFCAGDFIMWEGTEYTTVGSPNIGEAEDGSYTDGLFTDFGKCTKIGTAIDRFNEVLKGLAPAPAPDLDNITPSSSGATGGLSFGDSNEIVGYEKVEGIGSLPQTNVGGTFSNQKFGDDYRRGIVFVGNNFSGTLNGDIPSDGNNYPSGSFGNADQGVINLYLNEVLLVTANLASTSSSITETSSNGSSLNLSASDIGEFPSGEPFDLFIHRTGSFQINNSDMRNGWNYVQVEHVTGNTISTNYIDWVLDDDTTQITASNSNLSSLAMSGLRQVTGISYFTGGSAVYDVDVSNAYRNTYDKSSNAITLSGNNVSSASQALTVIGSGDESKVESINRTMIINSSSILNSSISVRVSVDHPRSADELNNGGTESIGNILLDNRNSSSTDTFEDFREETFRLEANNYDSQADIVPGNLFDSTIDRSSGGVAIQYNTNLSGIIPLTNGGDFTTIQNGPTPNVDYSVIPDGDLTYYRMIQNNTGGARTGFDLTLNGSGKIVTSLPLANNEILVEVKNPGKTGWLVFEPFGSGDQTSDGDGLLEGTLDDTLPAKNRGSFGGLFYNNGESIILRLTIPRDFSGFIDSITLVLL